MNRPPQESKRISETRLRDFAGACFKAAGFTWRSRGATRPTVDQRRSAGSTLPRSPTGSRLLRESARRID